MSRIAPPGPHLFTPSQKSYWEKELAAFGLHGRSGWFDFDDDGAVAVPMPDTAEGDDRCVMGWFNLSDDANHNGMLWERDGDSGVVGIVRSQWKDTAPANSISALCASTSGFREANTNTDSVFIGGLWYFICDAVDHSQTGVQYSLGDARNHPVDVTNGAAGTNDLYAATGKDLYIGGSVDAGTPSNDFSIPFVCYSSRVPSAVELEAIYQHPLAALEVFTQDEVLAFGFIPPCGTQPLLFLSQGDLVVAPMVNAGVKGSPYTGLPWQRTWVPGWDFVDGGLALVRVNNETQEVGRVRDLECAAV